MYGLFHCNKRESIELSYIYILLYYNFLVIPLIVALIHLNIFPVIL